MAENTEKVVRLESRMDQMEKSFETNVEEQRKHTEKVEKMLEKLVTRTEFQPVKNVVYGAVGMILTAVAMALVALVVIPK